MYGLIWSFVSILCREVRLISISALARRSDFFGLLPYASATVTKFCTGMAKLFLWASAICLSNCSQILFSAHTWPTYYYYYILHIILYSNFTDTLYMHSRKIQKKQQVNLYTALYLI